MKDHYSANGPEFLIELASIAAHVIAAKGGLSIEKAEDLATEITDSVADRRGGLVIYIPKGNWNGGALRWHELAERDLRIAREFDGTNRKEICRQYEISSARLYSIIREVRRQAAATRLCRDGHGAALSLK